MIDIHTHILPGVDDGAVSFEDAVDMLMMAQEAGTKKLILTPHSNQRGRFENYDPDIRRKYEAFLQSISSISIDIDLYLGMEIYGTEDVAEKILDGKLMGLNDSNYYLIEFPFRASSSYILDILRQIIEIKKIPVIAHPERYSCVVQDPRVLWDWMKLGSKIQINKGSIFGTFGNRVRKTALLLLSEGIVDYVASDCHDIEFRSPSFRNTKDYLELYYGIDYAEALLAGNAMVFLRGRKR